MKIDSYVIDTNFISSAFSPYEVNSSQAQRIIEEMRLEETLFAPVTVLMEIEASLDSHKYNTTKIIDEFFTQMVDEVIFIDNDFWQKYREVRSLIKHKLKTLDLTILTAAYMKNAVLLSFDKKLNQAAKSIGIKTHIDVGPL